MSSQAVHKSLPDIILVTCVHDHIVLSLGKG